MQEWFLHACILQHLAIVMDYSSNGLISETAHNKKWLDAKDLTDDKEIL